LWVKPSPIKRALAQTIGFPTSFAHSLSLLMLKAA
jgi:hypothetical protein